MGMTTEGGIHLTIGEIRADQPFRVCLHEADDVGADFWTNDPGEAAVVFWLMARRMMGKQAV